ncbi:MAG TPA: Ig-like domain-containing protein [Streptosporangiaceae bacterium]|nr:Ig-like domain-containing protein [Streptosporangiaceae bacterium]
MNEKLKWRTAGRLRRGAVVLGVLGLTAGAAVMTAGSALAGVGTEPGNVSLNPASGATSLTPTWTTTDGCPSGFQTSAQMADFTTSGTLISRISPVVSAGLTAGFSGQLDFSMQTLASTGGFGSGGTVEFSVGCWSGPGGTGTVHYTQSTFVTIPAGGGSYTTSATGPVITATTTTLTAPTATTTGTTITLSAAVTAADSTTPAGTVQFMVNGSNLGTPVAVNTGGVATPATQQTSFSTTGTQNVSAVFTPTATTYSGSTGTAQINVTQAGSITAGSEPISVTVPQSGALTVTVAPGTVTLSPASPATTPDETATGTLQGVTVSDTRNFVPGWAVSGQESNFTGSGSAAGGSISGNALGWTPTVVGSLTGGALLGGTVAPSGANTGSTGPGLGSTAALLAQAHAGSGLGTNVLSASLLLDIPTTVPAGPYAGSLTITYVTSNP